MKLFNVQIIFTDSKGQKIVAEGAFLSTTERGAIIQAKRVLKQNVRNVKIHSAIISKGE